MLIDTFRSPPLYRGRSKTIISCAAHLLIPHSVWCSTSRARATGDNAPTTPPIRNVHLLTDGHTVVCRRAAAALLLSELLASYGCETKYSCESPKSPLLGTST